MKNVCAARLATVTGGGPYVFVLPKGRFIPGTKLPLTESGTLGTNVSPAQRASNAALKQRLNDARWLRHEAIPDWAWGTVKTGRDEWWVPE
jgi:hypothetical protein